MSLDALIKKDRSGRGGKRAGPPRMKGGNGFKDKGFRGGRGGPAPRQFQQTVR
jgi:hypothetical protein